MVYRAVYVNANLYYWVVVIMVILVVLCVVGTLFRRHMRNRKIKGDSRQRFLERDSRWKKRGE